MCAAILLAGGRGMAYDWSLMNFNGTYGTYGTALDTCNLCHISAPFDMGRNTYGWDYWSANFVFSPALEAMDSDGDGFSNLAEIQALTLPGDRSSYPPQGPALVSLSILGPSSVNEGQTAAYGASASWDDGSTTTVTAAWYVTPGTYASIDGSGVLTAFQVASDQDVTVSATYDGTTATRTVRIVNVPPPPTTLPADAVTLKPVDGATGISVTAVVMATLKGSGDISSIVNANTFSLSAGGSAPSSLSGGGTTACTDGGNVTGTIDYNDSRTEATFTPTCKLSNATAYTAVVVPATGTQQPVLPAPVSSTFTTIAAAPDSDGDGVPDNEDNHPNDHGKASPPCVRGWGKILVERFGNAGIGIRNAEGISDMHPQLKRQGKPFGFSFRNGMVRYKLTNVPPGGSVTVAVTFPAGIPKGSKIFKGGPNGFREDRKAVVNGNKVTVTLRDGGEGDEDGVVNGEIDDPIGVAVPDSGTTGSTGGASASGGCSVAGGRGGWSEAIGSIGILAFVWLVLALLRRHPGRKT